jgi:hypothetical protein
MYSLLKRILIGSPLSSEALEDQRLSKRVALAVTRGYQHEEDGRGEHADAMAQSESSDADEHPFPLPASERPPVHYKPRGSADLDDVVELISRVIADS